MSEKQSSLWKAEVAANFDITSTSIHAQGFNGHVYGWSILNDRQIQKIDLLTSTCGRPCNIDK